MHNSPMTDDMLIHDTIQFLREEFPHDLVIYTEEEVKKKPEEKNVMNLIERHLPHVKLTASIPKKEASGQLVILLVEEVTNLDFYKNLARAIQDRFCPVKIVNATKLDKDKSWQEFFKENSCQLLLTHRQALPSHLEAVPKILLSAVDTYNNAETKKELWLAICKQLSQK